MFRPIFCWNHGEAGSFLFLSITSLTGLCRLKFWLWPSYTGKTTAPQRSKVAFCTILKQYGGWGECCLLSLIGVVLTTLKNTNASSLFPPSVPPPLSAGIGHTVKWVCYIPSTNECWALKDQPIDLLDFSLWTSYHGLSKMQTIGGNVINLEILSSFHYLQ